MEDGWYCVALLGKKGKGITLFWNGDILFSLFRAKEYVEWAERVYPENKGRYKIYKMVEVE